MTPKEKAQELFDKYFILNYDWDGVTKIEWSKEGALIAVDEILEATKMHQYAYGEIGIKTIYHNYWQEVKQEIEKL